MGMNDYVLGCDVLGAALPASKGARGGGDQKAIAAGNALIATGNKVAGKKRLAKIGKKLVSAGKQLVQKGQSAPVPGGAPSGGTAAVIPAAALAMPVPVPVFPFGTPGEVAARAAYAPPPPVPFGGPGKIAARAAMAPAPATAPLPGTRPVVKKGTATVRTTPQPTLQTTKASRVHGDDIFGDLLEDHVGAHLDPAAALADLSPATMAAYAINDMVNVINTVATMMDQLGASSPLVTQGQDLINRAWDVTDQYQTDAPGYDQLVGTAQQVTADANNWISRAQSAGASTAAPGAAAAAGVPVYGVPWQPSTAYAKGSQVSNQGNLYTNTSAGTSSTYGGPMGTATSIIDGTAVWAYAGVAPGAAAALDSGGGGGGGGGGDIPDSGDQGGGEEGGGDEGLGPDEAEAQDAESQMAAAERGDAIPSYEGDLSAVIDEGAAPADEGGGYQGYGFSQMVEAEMPELPFGGGTQQPDAFADLADSGDQANAEMDAAEAAPEAAPAPDQQVVGRDTKQFVLKSELPGVSNEAWTKFVVAMKTAELGDVSPSNALGAFELKPRRLADLGLVKNLSTKRSPNGRMIWIGDFIPPLTSKRFLTDPNLQYKAFVGSMKDYVQKLRSKQIPKPDGGPTDGMTMSGVLAVLHRSGPNGLKNWNDPSKRFEDTLKLYHAANGAF